MNWSLLPWDLLLFSLCGVVEETSNQFTIHGAGRIYPRLVRRHSSAYNATDGSHHDS
jgi:hypothetical protein